MVHRAHRWLLLVGLLCVLMLLAVELVMLKLRVVRHRNAVIDAAIYLEIVEHRRRPTRVHPANVMSGERFSSETGSMVEERKSDGNTELAARRVVTASESQYQLPTFVAHHILHLYYKHAIPSNNVPLPCSNFRIYQFAA